MKKFLPYVFVVILVLVVVLTGISFWRVKSNSEDKGPIPSEEKENAVRYVDTNIDGEKIVSKFEIVMNDKVKTLEIEYTYEEYLGEESYQSIKGKFGKCELFSVMNLNEGMKSKDEIFSVENLKNSITEKNFKMFKGLDGRYYLTIASNHIPSTSDIGTVQELFVFDDELKLIVDNSKENEVLGSSESFILTTEKIAYISKLEKDVNPWLPDEFGVCKGQNECNVKLEVLENGIKYLMTDDFENLVERQYFIRDGKFSYETLNTYKIESIVNLPY